MRIQFFDCESPVASPHSASGDGHSTLLSSVLRGAGAADHRGGGGARDRGQEELAQGRGQEGELPTRWAAPQDRHVQRRPRDALGLAKLKGLQLAPRALLLAVRFWS
eukprot:2026490-Pleurochrysis_carterae.AAC.3